MRVVLINGSRRERGCTYTALQEVEKALHEEGIETELHFVGERAVNGEIDVIVKEVATAVKTADAIVIGSPVYYASPSGEILAFLDRLYSVAGQDLKYKPGAALVSARRAGTTAAIDVLNKYFLINQQPVVSSQYWNMVHGNTPEEVLRDKEGIQIVRVLGKNLAWLLKNLEAGKAAGVKLPKEEQRKRTNFIR
jgi:multimeric flavodoxin WrbA